MIFFLIFFFQFLMLIYQTIGLHGSGYCGFLTAISQYDNTFWGVLLGLLATAVASSFAVCAAGNFFLLTQVSSIVHNVISPFAWLNGQRPSKHWIIQFYPIIIFFFRYTQSIGLRKRSALTKHNLSLPMNSCVIKVFNVRPQLPPKQPSLRNSITRLRTRIDTKARTDRRKKTEEKINAPLSPYTNITTLHRRWNMRTQ